MRMRTERIVNEAIELDVLTTMGPRITGFAPTGGTSVFAVTPDLTLDTGDGRGFRLVGGHRLWAAPEIPAATYIPDEEPPVIEELAGGLRFTQPPPPETGIEKSIEIRLPRDQPRAVITHRLTNLGPDAVIVAPWAITMLRTGGVAVLPFGRHPDDDFQADRSIVLWPYTTLEDGLIRLSDTHAEVIADRTEPAKIGTTLHRGWMAYILDDQVFVKRAAHLEYRAYADLGASGQVYCRAEFCELETLGPLTELAPSMSVTHRETWELHERSTLPDGISALAAELDARATA